MQKERAEARMTECNVQGYLFQEAGSRRVEGKFDGQHVTSDGGALLLREVEGRVGILSRFADCFKDHRTPHLIEHSVGELLSQRVYGLALGYEDLNDHDFLRHDPLIGLLAGKTDVLGESRSREQDRGKSTAGKSTLNRLELTPRNATKESRYKKIVCDAGKVDNLFVDVFLESFKRPPRLLIIDLDATDIPLYGKQEGRHYHGYYDDYCYLPLCIFCGEHLLVSRLRESDIDGSLGALDESKRLVSRIREVWPRVKIILRADSGFARDNLMSWCEASGVDYVFGLARNDRLVAELAAEFQQAQKQFEDTGRASRVYKDFRYRTLKSWTRSRRVVGKAEVLEKGPNPRFIVTSLPEKASRAVRLYEKRYCLRGDIENRIKEQFSLFADRLSTQTFRANQIRLYFSAVAYLLITALKRLGLKNTDFEKAQAETIRLRLFKVGARISISVRRIYFSFSAGYPFQQLFRAVYQKLVAT